METLKTLSMLIKLQKRNNFKFVNEDDVFKEIYENREKKEIVLKDIS